MNITGSNNVVTATISSGVYHTIVTSDSHTLIADEPLSAGGKDEGPDPGDFLRISLATCTAITLRMYANRKSFDVREIKVNVTSLQVDGKTIFQRDINIEGNIEEAQRKRMLQIANACPVHKALTNPIEILTQIV
jgi:putative redox protein